MTKVKGMCLPLSLEGLPASGSWDPLGYPLGSGDTVGHAFLVPSTETQPAHLILCLSCWSWRGMHHLPNSMKLPCGLFLKKEARGLKIPREHSEAPPALPCVLDLGSPPSPETRPPLTRWPPPDPPPRPHLTGWWVGGAIKLTETTHGPSPIFLFGEEPSGSSRAVATQQSLPFAGSL